VAIHRLAIESCHSRSAAGRYEASAGSGSTITFSGPSIVTRGVRGLRGSTPTVTYATERE
jgi:hypothetical protein